MFRLVAVVGLTGSGKSEVVSEFEGAGFAKIYFGSLTLEKLNEEKLEVNEANERMMREKLRAEHGMSAYAKLNIPKIEVEISKGDVVIDGLYSWEEYTALKEKFPTMEVVAVYSPPVLRYERLASRPVRPLTNAEAQSRDSAEIENLHKAGPIAMADYTISNTSTVVELKNAVQQILNGNN
ncbi:hypothetical protein A3A71_01840 [Candidatus Berkelbacteria bacterium RIFCSPLOWO2_01_FULL_50_28]|uniref:Dephospho-CoA kinase n=1 Tax=Candidatus Berkelbacteria bacterium RIFCSPLOWO2_01_FULL_50_28 TaxID=1797471 RepID=A0A1F5EBV0_9BACT|nr:MAG: hypothetical protein A3F39_00195 [Candidatus Berkelbacteria bacterium RIFCSPHIGHO2_12_FULL_50_11]OGD64770.1 MAG: hypothetical protein A3A71_01840 [Candidatus Berkelbacteria bacterium RIFCSPLOWO2_01_FULL_50_28]